MSFQLCILSNLDDEFLQWFHSDLQENIVNICEELPLSKYSLVLEL